MNDNKKNTILLRVITSIWIFLFFLCFFGLFYFTNQKHFLLILLGSFFVINASREMLMMSEKTKKINTFNKSFILIFVMLVFVWSFLSFTQELPNYLQFLFCDGAHISFNRLLFLVILASLIFFVFSPHFHTTDLGMHFIIILYIVFGTSIFLSFFIPFGGIVGFYIMIMAVLTDSFAFFIGYYFGKMKIFSKLSPKKTLEGYVAGSVISTILVFVFCYYVLPWTGFKIGIDFKQLQPFMLLIFILMTSFISQIGDLVTSKFKRDYNIKDFSNIFAGHGGFLDRFDSVLFISLFMKCFDLWWPFSLFLIR